MNHCRGLKPMLEFTSLPERIQDRPRRRRHRVRTPECPRVKAVSHGCGALNSLCDIKWVSPQFPPQNQSERDSRKRTARRKPKGVLAPLDVQSNNTPVAIVQSLRFEEEDNPHTTLYPTLLASVDPHQYNDSLLASVDPHQYNDSLLDISTSGNSRPDSLGNGAECAVIHAVSNRDSSGSGSVTLGDVSDQTVPDSHVPLRHSIESLLPVQLPSKFTLESEGLCEVESNCFMRDADETTAYSNETYDKNHLTTNVTELSDLLTTNVTELSDLVSNMSIELPQEYTSCNATNVLESRLSTDCNVTMVKNAVFKPPSFSTPYRYELKQDHCSYFKNGPKPPPCHKDPSDHLTKTTLKSVAPLQRPISIATSHGPSDSTFHLQVTESEDIDSILARETPQHLWVTPEIKIIDNSFL